MNKQLLAAFRRSKWTAYKLEQESGVSYSTLSRWKKGETVLSIDNAEKIATALGYRFDLTRSHEAWGGQFASPVYRGTGRTSRMIEEAKRLAESGKAVYVIAANEPQRRQLQSISGERVKVETASTAGNFDWEQLRLIGSHPNCVTLIDHYAIETRFAWLLDMLHRFDPPSRCSGADAYFVVLPHGPDKPFDHASQLEDEGWEVFVIKANEDEIYSKRVYG